MAVYTWLDRKSAYYKSTLRTKAYTVLSTIDSDIVRADNLYPNSLQGLELKYFRALAFLQCGSVKQSIEHFEKLLQVGISISGSGMILGLAEFHLAETAFNLYKDIIKARIRYQNAIIHFSDASNNEYVALSKLQICEINLLTLRYNDCLGPLLDVSKLLSDVSVESSKMDHIEDSEFLHLSGVNFRNERFKELPSRYLGIQSKVDYNIGKISKAFKSIDNALRLDELNDLKYSKINNLNIKAELYLEEEEYEESLQIFQECIDLISGNVRIYYAYLCNIYRSLASIYLSKAYDDEKRAFKYLMLSLNIAKQYQLILEACKVLAIYTELNGRDNVDKLSLSVNAENLIHWLELSSNTSSKAIKVSVFRSIGTYYYACTDFEEAISFLEKANMVNNSMSSDSFDLVEKKLDFIKEIGGQALKQKQQELEKAHTKIADQDALNENIDVLKKELDTKESDLKNISEELKDYLKIATHDFKEPIRNIVNMTQLLKNKIGGTLSKDQDELIDYVISCSLQLNGLSDDLIEYVNINHNNPKRSRLDIRDIISRINATEIKEGGSKHLNISLDLEVEHIDADYNSIYFLFKNLIKNAVQFSKSGIVPQIKIISRELDDHWKFAIMDNGIGIEDKHFADIFKPFTKLRRTSGPENNGIGLSICKKAVELHHGRIWLNSIPGKGTTFHFTIYKAVQLKENVHLKG